jgi:hypothetical protein
MLTSGDAILTEETLSGVSVTQQAPISLYISLLAIVKDTSFSLPCKWENDFLPHFRNEVVDVESSLLFNFIWLYAILKIQEYRNALKLNKTH